MPQESFLNELHKTQAVLHKVDEVVTRLHELVDSTDDALKCIEKDGYELLNQGSGNMVVCATTNIIESKEIRRFVDSLSPKNQPTLIEVKDTSEPKNICSMIQDLIQTRAKKISSGLVFLNLKVFPLGRPFTLAKTVIFGKRYFRDTGDLLKSIRKDLESKGMHVLEDRYLYGGGPLVFSILESLKSLDYVFAYEITIQETILNNGLLAEILRVIIDRVVRKNG